MTSEQLAEPFWVDKSTQNGTYEDLLTNLEHRLRVQKIARKNTLGTSISWEDAAQTAQIKLLQAVRAGKFREGNADAFYRWAATVARYAVIDLVRKEHHPPLSLDQPIPGTDLPIGDTISDPFDALEALERAELVQLAIAAITTLDETYPDRGYGILWNGYLQGYTQSQMAAELRLTQGAISKRWKELTKRVAEHLGLLKHQAIAVEQKSGGDTALRSRSQCRW
jgi:RNA polymerase sigma factor (sigma-70 family)